MKNIRVKSKDYYYLVTLLTQCKIPTYDGISTCKFLKPIFLPR